jgi:outer membrane protein TolC
MHTTQRTARLLTPALLIATLAGCATNPFGRDPLDTTQVAPAERLRSIGVFKLEALPEADEPTSAQQQLESAQQTFAAAEEITLDLETARATALSNNLNLSATLITPEIAAEAVNEEWKRFESVFTLSAAWSETDTPTASRLVGSQGRNQSITPGFRVPLLTGGTFTIQAPINRSATNNTFQTLNPAWTSDLEVSLSHNLLRGAGRRATTHAIRLADFSRQRSLAQTKLEVIGVLADIDRAYWRLYASRRALEVVEQQQRVAAEQLRRATRLEEAGTGTQVDVVRAQAGLANRVDSIIAAQNNVRLQERTLKQLMNMPGLGVDTSTRILVDSPPDPVQYVYDMDSLKHAALDNRMELLELEIQLAQDAANIAFSRNQKLPLVALAYTYRINGLAGSLGNAVDQAAQNEFEDWSVSLNAEFPIGNERAKSALAQSLLARLQTLATKDAREQSITTEVYNAVDQLQSTWQRILATRENVILSARLLDAEQRQFDVGRSTSTDVLDADANLADARLSEIQAIVDYQIAQIDLAVASGTLIGQARIDIPKRNLRNNPDALDRADDGVVEYSPLSGTLVTP